MSKPCDNFTWDLINQWEGSGLAKICCYGLTTCNNNIINNGCVSQCGLAIYTKKNVKAKEEFTKIKTFHYARI
jgi:hypothetical protein